MKKAPDHKGFLVLVGGLGLLAALYAWVAYAGEIETDINALATAVTQSTAVPGGSGSGVNKATGLPAYGLDASAEQLLIQKYNGIENLHNTAINSDMFAPTPMTTVDRLMTQHLSSYCSNPAESGQNCPQDSLLMFGDIKVSSLLTGSAYLDATRAQAAQDYLNTLLTPLDHSAVSNFQSNGQINAALLAQNTALKQQYVQALSDEALLSVIRQSFAEMIAKRTVPPAGNGSGNAMPLSEMQMMEENTLQRQLSSTWLQSLPNLNASQLQQEGLRMQATQLWMEQQRYRQMERVEALLALFNLQLFRQQKNAGAALNQAIAPPSAAVESGASSTNDNGGN